MRTIEAILDLARWAPSGDNTQPWRFEIIDDSHVVVHGFDTRDRCVYDLDGRASQLAIGALLETMAIAATGHGLEAVATRRTDMPETRPTFDVVFERRQGVVPSSLIPFIVTRCVQRRPMSLGALHRQSRHTLEASVGDGYRVLWLEDLWTRLRMANFLSRNGKLRLTMPEAYEVHRSIIAWGAEFSEDKVPDRAIGLDPLALKIMGWAMESWGRVRFLNAYLGGTLLPRLQLDWLPALACAAHFALLADSEPRNVDDFVRGGRAVQRFWLTAAALGIQLQPEMTPLIFARFIRKGVRFSASGKSQALAAQVCKDLDQLIKPADAAKAIFAGRVGAGSRAHARSLRLPLKALFNVACKK